MTAYTDIIDSLICGQLSQALEQVNEFGWFGFAREIQLDELLSDRDRVKYLTALIRAQYR
jgi:hypothetical protein